MELINDFVRLPSAACAFVVNNLSSGIIIIHPTCFLNSITPIYILTIHKNSSSSMPTWSIASRRINMKAPTRNRYRIPRRDSSILIGIDWSVGFSGKASKSRRHSKRTLTASGSPFASFVERTVWQYDFAATGSYDGILVHETQHRF